MIFSIRAIIRAFVAPNHLIRCSPGLWNDVLGELEKRGGGRHEAGAFLLGTITGGKRHIMDVVYYDDLDPSAYDNGVCILYGDSFSRLWAVCRGRGLTVVADVHTHPGGTDQSRSDMTNPMVARAGHVALIVPNFAKPPVSKPEVGVYQYRGDHQWLDKSGSHQPSFFYIGMWS